MKLFFVQLWNNFYYIIFFPGICYNVTSEICTQRKGSKIKNPRNFFKQFSDILQLVDVYIFEVIYNRFSKNILVHVSSSK